MSSKKKTFLLMFLVLLSLVTLAVSLPPPADFYAERKAVLEAEGATFLGANITLNLTVSYMMFNGFFMFKKKHSFHACHRKPQ